jgi:hypothetical protein
VKAEYTKLLEQNCRFITLENFMFLKNNVLVKIFTAKEVLKNFSENQLKYHSHTSLGALPIFRAFADRYANEVRVLRYVNSNSTMQDLYNYYKSKGWLRDYDISYYKISEKEGQALQYWEQVNERKNELVQALAFKKYGRLQRIGLTPTVALKIV